MIFCLLLYIMLNGCTQASCKASKTTSHSAVPIWSTEISSSSIQMFIFKKVSKFKCNLMLGREWMIVSKEYVSQSQNKDGKKQQDKYQCHQNRQWRVMPTFISVSHWVIGINLNYSHSKSTSHKNVWCQLITHVHFVLPD